MDSAHNQDLHRRIASVVQHIPGGALLFAVLMLVVLGYFGWYYYGADHLDHAFYSLRLEKVKVTPQPEWIRANVAEEVYNKNRLDRISLLDPRATAAIAQAFETHHWIKTTTRVSKSVGNNVLVDVVYRRPMAMIHVEYANPKSGETEEGFLPIDSEGTILPPDDLKDKVRKYFIVYAQNARLAGDIGMPYGDARIMEALSLCEYLEQYREEYGLEVIEIQQDSLTSGPSPWSLSAFTRDKRRKIIWGHAPKLEDRGELPAEEKLKQLLAWLKQPLPAQSTEEQTIDLRITSPMTPVSSRRK